MSHLILRSHSFTASEKNERMSKKCWWRQTRRMRSKKNAIHHSVWLKVEWNILMCKRGMGGSRHVAYGWTGGRSCLADLWNLIYLELLGLKSIASLIVAIDTAVHAVRSRRVSNSFLEKKKIFLVTAQNVASGEEMKRREIILIVAQQ